MHRLPHYSALLSLLLLFDGFFISILLFSIVNVLYLWALILHVGVTAGILTGEGWNRIGRVFWLYDIRVPLTRRDYWVSFNI